MTDYPHIVRRQDVERHESTFSHPWNPASEIRGVQLSRMAGLQRTGLSLAKLAPGKESFAYHAHHTEEEWIYILTGTVVAIIDGIECELQAGDFVAFPAPSVAHHLVNRSTEEAVYLMGGENREFEVADFPLLDRRMVRLKDNITIYRLSDGRPFGPITD